MTKPLDPTTSQAFQMMVAQAKRGGHLWTLHHDGSSVFAASASETPPTREALIHGWMTVPCQTIRKTPDGWDHGPVHYLTREQAEAKVGP